MGTPHKHRDVIIAWANGEEIEYWSDTAEKWYETDDPAWREHMEYRIKPKRVKKEGWVNVYGERRKGEASGYLGWAWVSKEEADVNCTDDRVACIRIEWEEEE